MLFNKLSDYEKDAIDRYIDYYTEDFSYGDRAPLRKILQYWNTEKVNLYHLLNDSLMYSENIEFEASENILNGYMNELLENSSFRRKINACINDAINENKISWGEYNSLSNLFFPDILVVNKYTGANRKIKFSDDFILNMQQGMKITKILSKLATYFNLDEEYEEFRLKHSQILNTKKLSGELVFSIHPLDFMTMSDNASGWTSCMSWKENGCYRRGTVEMMNSSSVVVVYLKSHNKDMKLCDNYFWNNKKWRELFIVNPDFITNIKGYPYIADNLTLKALEILTNLATKNWNATYEIKNRSYEHREPIYLNKEDESLYATLFFETNTMYNDFDATYHFGNFSEFMFNNGSYWYNYSGVANCMCCGNIEEFGGDWEEEEGGYLICLNCSDTFACDCCGSRCSGEQFEIDGYVVCRECYEDRAVYCYDDEDYHLSDYTEQINLTGTFNGLDYDCKMINVSEDCDFSEFGLDEEYFTHPVRENTKSWCNKHYVLVSDCTQKGLELFGIYSEKEAKEYERLHSLTLSQRSDVRWGRAEVIENEFGQLGVKYLDVKYLFSSDYETREVKDIGVLIDSITPIEC